jgi:Anti-sigma factor NepR
MTATGSIIMTGEVLRIRSGKGSGSGRQDGRGHPAGSAEGGQSTQPTDPAGGNGQHRDGFDQATQGHIGRLLKKSYDDLVQQPVPDRLLQILEELDRKEDKA